MRSISKAFLFTASATCLPLASGCIHEGIDDESDTDSAEVDAVESSLDIILPSCATAAANRSYYVYNTTGAITSQSSDGGYRYQTSDSCDRWVVDFKFGTTSSKRNIMGGTYDLPSSSGGLGRVPTNAYDCTHLQVLTTIYRKRSNEASFTALTSATNIGVWSGGACQLATPFVQADKSISGWDTYRVAVGVKLRGAWQQAAARLEPLPEG